MANEDPNRESDTRTLDFEDFVQMVADPEWEMRTGKEWAALFGVSESCISLWKKKIDWDWVKQQRRARFASKLTQVDDAMLQAARAGDVAAAKLVYERFDSWTPSSELRLVQNAHDDDLKRRAAELAAALSPEPKPAEGGTGPNTPGTGETGAR